MICIKTLKGSLKKYLETSSVSTVTSRNPSCVGSAVSPTPPVPHAERKQEALFTSQEDYNCNLAFKNSMGSKVAKKSKCVYWQEYTKNTIQAKNV